MLGTRFRLVAVFALVASIFATTMTAAAQNGPQYDPHQFDFATDEFYEVWERTDRPVEEGATERTWLWGPGANTPLLTEPYADSPTYDRQVQYTDKSRMEMPWNDDVDPESPWFITQGLLAREMMTGQLQLGDELLVDFFPSEIQVAGDPGSPGPTYKTMGEAMDNDPRSEGNVIVDVITESGYMFENPQLGPLYNVTDEYYIEQTGFYVASVFWDFMTSSGPVYEDDVLQTGQIFESPFYAIGYPITPAYWAWVEVNDVEQNVLVQCFERRCLTFTPDNPVDWQVESGNVGQHYFEWRYNQIGDVQIPDLDPAEATSFTVTPPDSSNAVGDSHEITVTVLDQHGAGFEGAGVSASVTETTTADDAHLGVELGPEDATTGEDGIATLSYTGIEEGTDTITVEVEGIEATQTVTKTWAEYTLALNPEESTNPLGATHEINVSVMDGDEEQVDIGAAGDVSASISRVLESSDDGNGENGNDDAIEINVYSVEVDEGVATLSYEGPDEPAQDTIAITVMVDGVAVSGTATKTWAGPGLILDPEDSNKLVGSEASLQATIEEVDGTQINIADDDDVSVEVTRDFNDDSTPDETLSTEVNGDITVQVAAGVATIIYDGADDPATDSIEVTVTADGVEYSATTTKTWGAAAVSVTPDDATNPYFQSDIVIVEFLNALAAAEDLEIALDGDALLEALADQNLVNGTPADWQQAFEDAGLTGTDLDAMVAALDEVNVNHHTVTVAVDAPDDASGSVNVVIEHTDDADTTTPVLDQNYTLENGSLNEEITYESNGIGTDSVTVTVNGTDFDFDDVKTWMNGVEDGAGTLTLSPLDPDPNPLGSEHTVTGTMQDNGEAPGPGYIAFSSDDGSHHNISEAWVVTDTNGEASFTYTGDSTTAGTDSISGYGVYLAENGFVGTLDSETPATKEWYVAPEYVQITSSSPYNHPSHAERDGIDVTVTVYDQNDQPMTDLDGQNIDIELPGEVAGGGQMYFDGSTQGYTQTLQTTDGTVELTIISSRELYARPTDVVINADIPDVTGSEDSVTITFPDSPLLTIVQNELDGAQQGDTGLDLIVSVINPPDGANIDEAVFKVTFSHEIPCDGSDIWTDVFEFTEIDTTAGPGQTQQTPQTYANFLNSTFSCENGDWVGQWGDGSDGEQIDAGFDQTDTFTLTVGATTSPGQWTLSSEMVDKDDNSIIYTTVTNTFTINAAS